jgi:hypothetical protein
MLERRFDLAAQRLALPAAGERQAWKRGTVIAQNQLKKRAESQPSGARFGGLSLFIEVALV